MVSMFRNCFFGALLLALPALGVAGDAYNHRVDEAKNKLGANRCSDSLDCDGKRTCSPHGWCQGTSRPATKSVDYHVDEAKNAKGSNRCIDSFDCDGNRTCSPHGWCQGISRPSAAAQATAVATPAPTRRELRKRARMERRRPVKPGKPSATAIPATVSAQALTAIATAVPTSVPTTLPAAVTTLAPTSVPTAAPTKVPSLVPTLAPTAAPTTAATVAPQAQASVRGTLSGPWRGMGHPKSGGLSPVTLSLVLAPGGDASLKGHGIVIVRGGKPRERNVNVVEGSYKEDGSLKFSLHFSEPEEEDLNLNFRGQLHKNERLIKGDWDQSGSGVGNFELHYQEGGN